MIIPGELPLGWYEFENNSLITRFNTQYEISDHHLLELNFIRQGTKSTPRLIKTNETISGEPTNTAETIIGLAWTGNWFDQRLQTTTFGKYYGYAANTKTSSPYVGNPDEQEEVAYDNTSWGGGFSASFRALKWLQVLTSIEKTVRLPLASEVLGSDFDIMRNPELKPENSTNFNLGLSFDNLSINEDHEFALQLKGFHRNIKDLISYKSYFQGVIPYNNPALIGKGWELDFNYNFKKMISFNINTSSLSLVNNEDDQSSNKQVFDEQQIPDMPTMMTSATLSFHQENVFLKGASLQSYVQYKYVNSYPITYFTAIGSDNDFWVPTNNNFNVGVSYTFPFKVGIAFDVTNLLDAEHYDYHKMMKPGRAYWMKLSYNL
ncbi:TonB-dependent receptor [Flammeovirga sp. EKP202]|uniref:TonB-dependent receptor domain-containing protein n=1 Tax=Flammeovirga sp. EKP202 TaxID=2770592 RepID=UPI00165EC43F|nr:TonB-dependent receptor [Flammeovirga sp. EKP202]MBD0403013.1 TonB-dependent receptor [Flammeovirga sp. EKP202]